MNQIKLKALTNLSQQVIGLNLQVSDKIAGMIDILEKAIKEE